MSETYTDDHLRDILRRTRRIAVVGASMNPERASNYVARFLIDKGYEVVPVNPGHAGETLFGVPVVAELGDIVGDVDMVEIFRRSEHVPAVVDAALARFPDLQTIWMQIGVEHDGAAQKARARGVDVIMDRCPKVEYPRVIKD